MGIFVKKIFLLLLLIIFGFYDLQANMISGVSVKKSITIQNQQLYLNGAGIRSILFFDLYIGALYLKNTSHNAKKIISSKEPMDIRMYITSSLISSGKLKSGFKDAFSKSKNAGYKTNAKTINSFLKSFNANINKKDIFDFAFFPNKGVNIYKNGKLIQSINNFIFKKALFAIWLSSNPAQKSLKEKMLGR